jgi:hypothetical protein
MGDLEAMTVDYVNVELAVKQGNPKVICAAVRSASPGPAGFEQPQPHPVR